MNKFTQLFLFLSIIGTTSEGMQKKLHAKYSHQEVSQKSPKDKSLNEHMAREEMLFNMSACVCHYRGRKIKYCTTCPENNTNKAREYVVVYYA